MDEIKYRCPKCGKELFVTNKHFDLQIRCHRCGTHITAKGQTGKLETYYVSKGNQVIEPTK